MASSRQIEHAAAAWLARRDGDAWDGPAQQALEAWLGESIAHRVAFLRLEAAWENTGRLKALGAGIPAGVIPARGQWMRSPFGDGPAGGAAVSAQAEPSADPPRELPALPDLRGLAFAPRHRVAVVAWRPSRGRRWRSSSCWPWSPAGAGNASGRSNRLPT